MATAAELFASLNAEEPHIVINSDRTVTIPEELKSAVVQYDHNIETVTFDCPRYWDGNDLSEMTISINYERPDGHEGSYVCKNVTIDNNDSNVMHFDWTISSDATEAAGNLLFIVCVKKAYVDGTTSQIWHSRRCETFPVIKGLKCAQPATPSDPEQSGVQVDYNQNSETAPDYIKNRPFYKISTVYKYKHVDFVNSSPVAEDRYGKYYKISDDVVDAKELNNAILIISDSGEQQSMILTSDGDNPSLDIQYDDDNTTPLCALIIETLIMCYTDTPISSYTTLPKGLYWMLESEADVSEITMQVDSIESVLQIKKISKEFIPDLDYASISSLKSVQSTASSALSTANTLRSSVQYAINEATQAQTDLETAKKEQAVTNNQLQADIKSLQQNAFPIKSLHIDNAAFLLAGSQFTTSPFNMFASKNFNMTFSGCNKMTTCSIYSFDDYMPVNISSMFSYCSALTKIYSSNKSVGRPCLNLSKCTSAYLPFQGCKNLTNIYKITNIGISLDFADCPLDDATVNMLIANLVASDTSKTLTLKSDIVKKLTNEQLAKVPSGWTIQ